MYIASMSAGSNRIRRDGVTTCRTRPDFAHRRRVSGETPTSLAASPDVSSFGTFCTFIVKLCNAQAVQSSATCAVFVYDCSMTTTKVQHGLAPDEAIGMTINQHLFARKMSGNSFGPVIGVSGATVSRKLRGNVGWSVTELLTAASFFGIEPADLMPTPDGMGGWIPAPFKPARRRDVDTLVPQVGLEPTTHGL